MKAKPPPISGHAHAAAANGHQQAMRAHMDAAKRLERAGDHNGAWRARKQAEHHKTNYEFRAPRAGRGHVSAPADRGSAEHRAAVRAAAAAHGTPRRGTGTRGGAIYGAPQRTGRRP